VRRISIRGGTFSYHGDSINLVIVNAAKVSRAYFKNEFDSDKTVAPTCWSSNTQVPDTSVPVEQKQATRCMDCRQNIRGSSGYGRACRFLQRLAVVVENNLEEVCQLQLPATSIFGKTVGGGMPLQEYARHLHSNNTSATTILTNAYFDKNSSVPKVLFKPIRTLEKHEVAVVTELVNHPDTRAAITSVEKQSTNPSPFDSVEGYVYK